MPRRSPHRRTPAFAATPRAALALSALAALAAAAVLPSAAPAAEATGAPAIITPAIVAPANGSPAAFAPAPIARAPIVDPRWLSAAGDDSVYAPPGPPRPEEGVNEGGVHLDLTLTYADKYIYRGVQPFDFSNSPGGNSGGLAGDLNLQVNARVSFDLGKAPSPFFGVFANVADNDPIQSFQEIRPFFGFDWTVKPFTFTAGYNAYIYPDRDALQTSEVYARLALDDRFLFGTEKPVLSPYIYGAYDIDKYDGFYLEAGIEHRFEIDRTGLSLTPSAAVAYVLNHPLYANTPGGRDSGAQHAQVGLTAAYSLNRLFNVSQRYGEWSLEGYLFYTDGLSDRLRADTELFGGAGIRFRY